MVEETQYFIVIINIVLVLILLESFYFMTRFLKLLQYYY